MKKHRSRDTVSRSPTKRTAASRASSGKKPRNDLPLHRLEAVLDTINDHLVNYDLQWRYTYVNDRAAAVLRLPKEELLGKCIWDLFPEAIGNQYYKELHLALAEQRVIRSEHYYAPFATWFENYIYPHPDGVTVFSTDITMRKKAEQALRDSEQRFARFMQNLPGLAWIKDTRGRYVYANDAAARVFQVGLDDLYGKTDAEVFPPEIATQFRNNDLRALESGNRIETVETLQHSDGVVHHSIVSKFPIFDETGEATLIGGIAIDITERKNAEFALQESENRFRMMANATPALIWTADPDGIITFLSDRWFEYSGVEREQQAKERPSILHPGDIERREQAWRAALRNGTPYEIEVRMRRHDGEYRWFISRAVPIRNQAGEIKGWFGSSTDIHDRKLAEIALRESETRFRLMANATTSIIWTADPDGAITFSSDRWFEYTGISRERNVRDWPEVLHPDDIDRCTREWTAALRNGTPYEIEVRNRRHDGEYRWFITRAIPVHDETGAIKCWFGSTTDIHDRKMAEEALKEADRRKDRFLATLAHELRNPLAPIRNSLHLLRMPIDKAAIERVHDMMERQINHMVRLVDDLMEVSRITRGQIELRKVPLDLATVIQNSVETSLPLIEAAGHHLEISLPPEAIQLDADPVRLAQIFSNLLNNAAKYTEHGGRIRLAAWREEDSVIVSVRDNGIGIDAEALPHIFDMLNRARHNVRGGLGVGLTLARNMVQMHGGGIEAHSEGPGHGSEFIVRLPSAPGAEPIAAPPVPVSDARTPLCILVVDDNRDAADSLCMLLRFLGHTPHVAHDGPSALAAVETHRPGIVLLDLGMPGMDGYEVARRIRQRRKSGDIALIALTGWGQEEDRRRTQAAGFDRHLVKPVDLNLLQSLLAEF
jgi:PAS domain S-box-containing protein